MSKKKALLLATCILVIFWYFCIDTIFAKYYLTAISDQKIDANENERIEKKLIEIAERRPDIFLSHAQSKRIDYVYSAVNVLGKISQPKAIDSLRSIPFWGPTGEICSFPHPFATLELDRLNASGATDGIVYYFFSEPKVQDRIVQRIKENPEKYRESFQKFLGGSQGPKRERYLRIWRWCDPGYTE